MENIIFALQNVAINIQNTISVLLSRELVWGFAIGFLASTMIHLLIVSENPRLIPHILTKSKHKSFKHLSEKDKKGAYKWAYTTFQQEYDRVKMTFYAALLAFFLFATLALARY